MAVTEKQRRAMNREIAQEQAMINRRLEAEKYMQAEIEKEAASRIPSVPTVNNPMSADPRSANFIPTNQIGLLPRPPVTYTAEGSRMQTPPLSMPTAQALLGASTPVKQIGPAMQGIRIGNDQGDANRSKEEQLGFMDKIFDNPMLQRMMERSLYSQPTFGGNFISEQASGERGLRSMEAQSAELAQKKAMENNKIQATLRAAELKAGKGVKPDGTLATLTRSYYKSSQGVDLLTQMKNLTTEGAAGGPLAVSENALNAILTSFGGNPEESTAAKLGVLRAQLMDSFTFTGKDISEADKKIIDELLPPTGGLTLSKKQFTFALNKLLAKLSNEKTFAGNSIRTDYGRNPDQYTRREAKPKLTVTSSRQVSK